MDALEKRLAGELKKLELAGNMRELKTLSPHGKYVKHNGREYLNLSSNDYLGLASQTEYSAGLQKEFLRSLADREDEFLMSSPASRLMTGNSTHYEQLEEAVSRLFGGREALVLSSGFMANAGTLPALTGKEDLILADRLIHASLIDGLRLGSAEWKRFRHNDMEHLQKLLEQARNRRTVWVVTESIFSMDGDTAPLTELMELKARYGFRLYLDEAHAFGVRGPDGRGLAAELGAEEGCDIRMATLGKAMASAGSFVLCSGPVKRCLVNRMRTLIFSTALPPVNLMWSEFLIRRLPGMGALRAHLREMTALLARELGIEAHSQIIPLPAGSNVRALTLARRGRENGYWLTPIRHPTVPEGTARIRLSLTAALTRADILGFARSWKQSG